LQYQIKRCMGPCVLPVAADVYREQVRQTYVIYRRSAARVDRRVEAAHVGEVRGLGVRGGGAQSRSDSAVEKTLEKQRMVAHWGSDQDIFGLYREGGFIEVQVLLVRQGKLTGSQSYSLTDLEFPDEEIVGSLLNSVLSRPAIRS
jgi:excinuclease ABC subunit C